MNGGDFLPNLKRRSADSNFGHIAGSGSGGEFWFQLRPDTVQGTVWLVTVDKSLAPVSPYAGDFTGPESILLRSIEGVKRENGRFSISWGRSTADNRGVDLSRYPHLMYQLLRCPNILGPAGEPVNVSDDAAMLRFRLDDTAGSINPLWQLIVPARAEEEPVEPLGLADFTLLTDSFVLAHGVIYPIESLGENFDQLPFFESPVAPDMLEPLLSVVYTYIDNFQLDYKGYAVVHLDDPLEMKTAIIFEKVDPDKALHLRVARVLPGMSSEFLQRFELTRIATTDSGMERVVTVRPLHRGSLREDVDSLRDLIIRNSTSKKEARDMYVEDDYFIIPPAVAGPFLLRSLPYLLSHYIIIGADKLKEYKVSPVRPHLNMRFHSGIDFLEGDATVSLGDDEISLGKLFEQYRRDRFVTLSNGTRAVLDDGYMKKLERLFGDKRDAGKNVRVNYLDLPDIEEMLEVPLDPALFKRERKVYEGFNDLAGQTLEVPGLNATLRSYQKEGVKWIKYLHDNNLGGCLADDMGLGKTIQTIAMLSGIYPAESKPTLIVMPRSLLFNWNNEFQRFNPSITLYTYYQGTRDIDEAMKHNVILTTYAMVRNDIEKFDKQEFYYVILDESQNIKNLEAQVTRAVFLLKADHRLALSGTPVENNLSELFSLFRFLNPGMLGDLDDFNRRYAGPIQRDDDKDAMTSLRRRIHPFMLRRLKKDVLQDLPDRVEQTLSVEMSREQAEFYEQRRAFYLDKIQRSIATDGVKKSQFVMFQALTEMRRIASVPESLSDGAIRSPKLDVLMDSLAEAVGNGHKCVVFFNYIAGLELTGERLAALGIDYETMTGATTNRSKVVNRFNNDPACKVFLMTLKTGGVGLNLTVADTVFIFEPWWNKAAEEQAINRLHRIGQKAKVHSYSLITLGTIEEKIRTLQEKKAMLFDGLIGTDATTSKFLSEEDINFIFGA